MMERIGWTMAKLVFLLFGALLTFLVVFTLFVRLGLPMLNSQKDGIETRISEYLQGPVEIGGLSLYWEGFGPLLKANDVTVLESENRAVRLDELLIDVNLLKSAIQRKPVINEITLVGADFELETDISGQVKFHGKQLVNVSARSPEAGTSKKSRGVNLAAWLLNANKVGLQDARLTITDIRTSEALVIDDLNIRAENSGKLHQIRVDALLPTELGGRITAGIDLIGDARELDASHGSVYVGADALDWRGLSQLLLLSGLFDDSELLNANIDANASLELWGTWQDGRLVSVRGPLEINQVVDLNTGKTLLDNVNAQVRLLHDESESTVLATALNVSFGDQTLTIDEVLATRLFVPTPESSAKPSNSDDGSSTDLTAGLAGETRWLLNSQSKHLPAELTKRIAELGLVFINPELTTHLAQLQLDGSLSNVVLSLDGSGKVSKLDLQADINGLAFGGHPDIPSMGPLNGTVSLADSIGQLSLFGNDVALQWQAAKDEGLVIDSLRASMDLDFRNPSKLLVNADMQLSDEGIETDTRIKATLVADGSPHLDVQSRFSASDITAFKVWVPDKLLAPAAVEWIDTAITAGRAENGTLLFFGEVADFPFDQGEGVLNAQADIKNGTVSYLEGWPASENISGTMELDGLSLSADVSSASIDEFNVSQAQLSIADLLLPVFTFESTANGSFDDLVDFSIHGPLNDVLEPIVGDMIASGEAQMDLELEYPLYDQPSAIDDEDLLEVNGSLFFNGNDVELGEAELTLTDVQGAVGFDEWGISVNSLRANVLGHPVNITGKTVGQAPSLTTIIKVQGSVEANDLLAHYENTLDRYIHGASQWIVTLSAPHSDELLDKEGVSLTIESDLVGSELLLPHPFAKTSDTAAAFSLKTAFKTDIDDQTWEARYDGRLRAQASVVDDELLALILDIAPDRTLYNNNTPATVEADLLGLDGIFLQGEVKSFPLVEWVETMSDYIDSLPVEEGEETPILPISGEFSAEAMTIYGVGLGPIDMSVNSDKVYLNAVVSNEAVSGNLSYPREHWSKEIPMKANVSSLDWSVIDALSTEIDELETSETDYMDPRLLPPIEARISTLVRDKMELKDLVIRAQPNVSGIDITTFGFAYDTMRMVGQGFWYLKDPQNLTTTLSDKHVSQLSLVVQSDDFGAGLDHIGLDGLVGGGIGSVAMNLNWPGPFYIPEFPRLDGDIKVDIRDGSIVSVEPEAGRVVGLFAIEELPRRLNLDFKDLTGVGLAFTEISGTANIDNGIANVPLLQLSGPIGVVDIVGTTDLDSETIDQKITVLPRISAALPVIGLIAGGASGGIGALVAAGVLKALGMDFDRLGLVSYSLTGSWEEPKFARISNSQ